LRGAVFDDPRLTAIPVEEAASQLVLGGATCRRSLRQRRHKERSYLAVEVSTLLCTSAWAEKLTELGTKQAKFQDMAAEGLITFDELREKLAQLDETRKVAEQELINLEYRKERISQLEQNKASLLKDFTDLMPDALDALTGEVRHRIYNLLRTEGHRRS
jgi:hypothetical protein